MPLGGKSSAILFVPVAHELPPDVGPLVVIPARLEYKVLLSPRARPMLSQLNMYARCRVAHTQNTPTLVIGPTITPGSQLIHSQ